MFSRSSQFFACPVCKALAFLALIASGLHPSSGLAQSDDKSTPTPQFSQAGRKNRIVFDYDEAATPTPSPSPSPTPSSFKVSDTETLVPLSPAPSPTLAPEATPTPMPEATPAPTPKATPSPEPTVAGNSLQEAADTSAASRAEEAKAAAANHRPTPSPSAMPETPVASTPAESAVTTAPAPSSVKPVSSAPSTAAETANGPEGALPVESVEMTETVNVVEETTPDLAPAMGDTEKPRTPSESVTINLITKLVARGILTKEDAAEMISQAEAEAQAAREQTQMDMFAIAQAAAVQAAGDQAALAGPPAASADDVRVTYIPEPVKLQIKEDIKTEILAESKSGKFRLGPHTPMPFWVSKVRPFADLRLRYEGDFFPNGNDATGAFPNFNAINTGAPYDVTGNEYAPQFNVDQNRNRFRIRLRLGAEVDISDSLTGGIRLATGENNSPVTTNQTLGLANQGQGGNFSKYAIWLDRAFIRYNIGQDPDKSVTVLAGRFDNPFFSTNMIWDDELGFDGVALQGRYEILDGVVPFFAAGAFPVFNTDFNFSSNQPSKFQSYDKYLFGGQLGLDLKIAEDWQIKVATSYYYFYNVEGKLSSPYTPLSADDAGDTDNSRPSFAQKGNTYFPIRNIVPDASNDYGAIDQYQYYGLATKFQELAVTARIDYNGFEPLQVSLIGEFVQNLSFNKGDIDAIAVNNRGALDDNLSNNIGSFEGSGQAWMVDLRIGTPALAKAWDWGLSFGYRWIGSDAVVDGFNDSDFGLGGTNMQGFTVGGALALSSNVWVGARWMGSDNIAGPTYKVNIIQLDLNTKF